MSAVNPAAVRGANPVVTMAAVLLAVLVVPMSISGAAMALPAIGADLNASLAPLQWVVNAFNLTFAAFTLAWGSLADLFGRRRAFAAGAAIYAAASVLSAVANDVLILDVARGLAGAGGAAVFSCGAAIVATTYDGPARARAFALFGTTAGLGVALGPTVAGGLTGAFGWRSVFVLNAVVLAVVLVAVPFMAGDRDAPAGATRPRVDWTGIGIFVISLFVLMLGVVQGPQWGWASGRVLALFAASAVLFALFVVVERRQAQPMLDLSLFRQPRFMALCLVPVAASFGFVTMLTYLPTYFVGADGRSSQTAGALMLLLTLPVLVCPLLAGRLVTAGVPDRVVLLVSMVFLVAGDAWLTVLHPGAGVATIVGPMLLVGAGMGLSAGLVDGMAIGAVPQQQAGMAAGLLNTLRLGSEAVAVAAVGSLLASFVRGRLDDDVARYTTASPDEVANQVATGDVAGAAAGVAPASRPGYTDFLADALTGTFHSVLWIMAVICAVATVAVWALLRRGRTAAPSPAEAAPAATGS
ncbi:MFS transporter [Actinoplanes sp. NEAU-A12]|uniref:MFS transporter n=1 Tax=Actinoplanes sandaracinus TaxID=3045177 RepID=A0ABT6X0E8_9ACTN|nr:MFS transporter [Actinoplanes sandaracinus]MDI6105459.1 MFS transporter [Actinoplanes sandaracinus]